MPRKTEATTPQTQTEGTSAPSALEARRYPVQLRTTFVRLERRCTNAWRRTNASRKESANVRG